jgi:hypothetical protein
LESSGSEDEGDSDDADSDVSDEELELGGKRRMRLPGDYSASDESDSEDESDEDEDEEDEDNLNVDLSETDEPVSAFPPESEIDQDEDEEEEDVGPTTDPTNRIACVNLDWDNLQAADLFAVFSSFLRTDARKIKGKKAGPGGKVLSVKIYPSEFGKERMKKEEEEGPGGGVFVTRPKVKAKNDSQARFEDEYESEDDSEMGSEMEDLSDIEEGDEEDSDEDVEDGEDEEEGSEEGSGDEDEDDSEGEDGYALPDMSRSAADVDEDDEDDRSSRAGSEDIDMNQLRQYQLERLRYYYAVATFSSIEAAEYVMAECNGTEFERTANVFDLTYVPEGMEFEDDEVK